MLFSAMLLWILISVLYKSKSSTEKRLNFFDRQSTDALRGVFAVIIVLNHYAQHVSAVTLAGRIFMYSGSCAVGFFFLISGYANYLSYSKNKEKKLHWLKKVLQLLAITEVINIIDNLLFEQSWYMGKLNILNYGYWFILVLMWLYVLLHIVLRYFGKYDVIVFWVVIIAYMITLNKLDYSDTWYNSVACFALGITVAKYKEILFVFFEKINVKVLMILLLPIIIFLYHKTMTVVYPYNISVSLVFNIFIVLFLYQFNFHLKFWSLLGVISLELYLWHGKMLYRVITVNGQVYNDLSQFIIFMAMSIALSFLVSWIINFCIRSIKTLQSKRV